MEAEVGVDAACALPLVEVAAVGAEAAGGVAEKVVVEEFAAAGVGFKAAEYGDIGWCRRRGRACVRRR